MATKTVSMAVLLLVTMLLFIAVERSEGKHTQFKWWSSAKECKSVGGNNYKKRANPDCKCHQIGGTLHGYEVDYVDSQYVQLFNATGCGNGTRNAIFTTSIARSCGAALGWKAVMIGRCGLGGA